MKLRLLMPLAWRNLWRNPRRTGLLLLAVSIALWSIAASTSLMEAWAQSTVQGNLQELTGAGQLHAPGYRDNPEIHYRMAPPTSAVRHVLSNPEINAWASRIRVPAVVQSERDSLPVTFLGIQPQREKGLSFIGDGVIKGRMLKSPDDTGIVVGRELVKKLSTGLGKRIVVMSQSASGKLAERSFTIVGIYAAADRVEKTYVFTGLHTAQTMLGAGNSVSEVAFNLHHLDRLPPIITRLKKAAPQLDVAPWQKLRPLAQAIDQLSHSFVGVWLGVMSILVVFGVANTLLMSVFERTREFGLLQALGMRPRFIVMQMLLESAFLLAMGTVAGCLAALATIYAFSGGLDLSFLARGAEWLGASRVLYPQLDPASMVESSLVVFVAGLAASLWPAWRAAHQDPTQAMSN